MLGDMAVGIEMSRLAWMRAVWETVQGQRNTCYVPLAKAEAADIANKCATDAVQVSQMLL
jgi:acyl-CoA dehydrogenase